MVLISAAIVDNKKECIQRVQNALEEWKRNKVDCEFDIAAYKTGDDILQSNLNEYQIVFLDAELNYDMNGVTVAQKMRSKGYQGLIVFIAVSQQYALSGYRVKATDFIIKPVDCKKIEWSMNQLHDCFSQENLICKEGRKMTKVQYAQILYFQSSKHYVDVISKTKKFHIKSTFKLLTKLLPTQFIQCHRTIIVNIMKIKYIDKKDIIMFNNEVLPIGNNFANSIIQAYRHNCF